MMAELRGHAATQPRTGRAHSFTLIELLIVVVLVGLTATIVTLRLAGTTERARLRAATMGIEQALRQARHRATKHRQPVWLQFQTGTGRYRAAAAPDQDGPAGVWRVLERVTIVRGAVRGAGPASSFVDAFTIRVTPTGASLPWSLEIRAGKRHRVVWTDGVTGRVRYADDVGLDTFRWDDATEAHR